MIGRENGGKAREEKAENVNGNSRERAMAVQNTTMGRMTKYNLQGNDISIPKDRLGKRDKCARYLRRC